ncbi:MAG TPA: hypothetical protein VGS06_40785 [Streptosporangiaceae bacterium]|nr:hypothetical protein [Streptosporangiaceae bacterium]
MTTAPAPAGPRVLLLVPARTYRAAASCWPPPGCGLDLVVSLRAAHKRPT